MIHTKSLIRRLDCVPWLLTACLTLVWAGEAQAQGGGWLVVKTGTGEAVKLELDVQEVSEGALSTDGSHADAASVPVLVTATRLKTEGADKGKDMADADAPDARMHIPLGFLVGSGTAGGDPLELTAPTTGDTYDKGRFILSMPVLVIEKKVAKGTATILFVPDDDDLMGNDAFDEGRGTSADDGVAAAIAAAVVDLAKAAAKAAAAFEALPDTDTRTARAN